MYYFNFLTESKEDCCQWQDFSSRKYQGCHGMAPIDFGRSVIPISVRGSFYAHHITTGIPGFSNLPTDLWNGASQLLSSKNGGKLLSVFYISTTKQQKTQKASKHSLNSSPHGFINFQSWILNFHKSCLLIIVFLFYQTILIGLKKSWKFRISDLEFVKPGGEQAQKILKSNEIIEFWELD